MTASLIIDVIDHSKSCSKMNNQSPLDLSVSNYFEIVIILKCVLSYSLLSETSASRESLIVLSAK